MASRSRSSSRRRSLGMTSVVVLLVRGAGWRMPVSLAKLEVSGATRDLAAERFGAKRGHTQEKPPKIRVTAAN